MSRELLERFHRRQADIDQAAVETALSLTEPSETSQSLLSLLSAIGNHNIAFEATPFAEIRSIFEFLSPSDSDVVYDLGAGYGHFVLYGAAVTGARFVAVEIVPERCAAISRAADQSRITRVDVLNEDAERVDLSLATMIFLNNPFFPDKAVRVVERLANMSCHRAPLIVATNQIVTLFRNSPMFAEFDSQLGIAAFRFGVFQQRQCSV